MAEDSHNPSDKGDGDHANGGYPPASVPVSRSDNGPSEFPSDTDSETEMILANTNISDTDAGTPKVISANTYDKLLEYFHTQVMRKREREEEEEVASSGTTAVENNENITRKKLKNSSETEHDQSSAAVKLEEDICIEDGYFSSTNDDQTAEAKKKKKRKIYRSIEIDDLPPYYGRTTIVETSLGLDVSIATLKRLCWKHGIFSWPYLACPTNLRVPARVSIGIIGLFAIQWDRSPPDDSEDNNRSFFCTPSGSRQSWMMNSDLTRQDKGKLKVEVLDMSVSLKETGQMIKFYLEYPTSLPQLWRILAYKFKLPEERIEEKLQLAFVDVHGENVSIMHPEDWEETCMTRSLLPQVKLVMSKAPDMSWI